MQHTVYATKELTQGQHDLFAAMEIDAVICARAAFGPDLPMSFQYDGRRWDHYSNGMLDGKWVALCYRRKI